jgi:very-short-patch-repair endonuclease
MTDLTPSPPERILCRAELRAEGLSGRAITRAVRAGELIRIRRDHYVLPEARITAFDRAVRIGGRLTCISLLAMLGVFTVDDGALHVRVPQNAGRLRWSHGTRPRTRSRKERGTVLHWRDHAQAPSARDRVALADAVADLICCRPPSHVIAALDSLLHKNMLTMDELEDIFATLPSRYRVLLSMVDGRAESGTESIVRYLFRKLGAHVEVQVWIGRDRVDLVVDDWLTVECDSRTFHEGWEMQCKDRYRDLNAARLGYTPIRPIAKDVTERTDEVFLWLRDILRAPIRRRS